MTDAASGAGPLRRATAPPDAEQREQFEAWFYSPGHQAYMAAVAAGGGIPLDDPEKAFALYRKRWTKPQPPTI